MDQRNGVSSTVMQALLWFLVVEKVLNQKANNIIHLRSNRHLWPWAMNHNYRWRSLLICIKRRQVTSRSNCFLLPVLLSTNITRTNSGWTSAFLHFWACYIRLVHSDLHRRAWTFFNRFSRSYLTSILTKKVAHWLKKVHMTRPQNASFNWLWNKPISFEPCSDFTNVQPIKFPVCQRFGFVKKVFINMMTPISTMLAN